MTMDEALDQLVTQLQGKTAKVMVVGLGYAGLPLAECIASAGFDVIGYDIDPNKVKTLQQGESYLETIPASRVQSLLSTGKFKATSDIATAEPCAVYWICVPTPLVNGAPTLDILYNAINAVSIVAKTPFLVVVSSTSFPGTTRSIGLSILEEDRKEDRNFFLAFSQEREDPGNTKFTTRTLPRVFGALNDASAKVASVLFNQLFDEVHQASSMEAAEASKMMENVYRAVNIALANEWADICNQLGLDVWEVIKLAATKPFGFQAFYPGPGVGGHCIPVDPYYLLQKLQSMGSDAELISLACELNKKRPSVIVGKLVEFLGLYTHRFDESFPILLIGMSYKKNVGDLRGSPALDILDLLCREGFDVTWYDPLVAKTDLDLESLRETTLSSILLNEQAVCIILSDHDIIDWDMVLAHSNFVFDTKNKYAKCEGADLLKLIRL